MKIPKIIPGSKVREFVAGLGITPGDVREIHLGMDGVYVEAYAVNVQGNRYLNPDRSPAIHRVAIEIDWQK